jgi:hypothetical protein
LTEKLISMKGGNKPSITRETIRLMKEELPYILEYFPIYAEMTKAKFEALKEKGFTEIQALELCKGFML